MKGEDDGKNNHLEVVRGGAKVNQPVTGGKPRGNSVDEQTVVDFVGRHGLSLRGRLGTHASA